MLARQGHDHACQGHDAVAHRHGDACRIAERQLVQDVPDVAGDLATAVVITSSTRRRRWSLAAR
jgi:hypothetical protein